MLFIVIHQVYELWFEQLLHWIEAAMRFLAANKLLKVQKNFRRIHAIQRVLEHQVDILETMTPQEFNAFRDGLDPANPRNSARWSSCAELRKRATCAFVQGARESLSVADLAQRTADAPREARLCGRAARHT